jgi:hypothetical protein
MRAAHGPIEAYLTTGRAIEACLVPCDARPTDSRQLLSILLDGRLVLLHPAGLRTFHGPDRSS